MAGDTWNQLVGVPSGTEVEAALADVRLRAVPIARRNARNRKAMTLLTCAVALGGAFVAGGLNASNGVHLGALGSADGDYRGHPVLLAAPGPVAATAPATGMGSTVRRFRVTSWTEWYGERFGLDEAYIEGPPGTSFAFGHAMPFDARQLSVKGSVRYNLTRDSLSISIESFARSQFGRSPRGLALFEEGNSFQQVTVPRGQAVLYYPLGRGDGENPVAVLRIEGPDVAAPPHNIHWDSVSAFAESWLRELGNDVRSRLLATRSRAVRFGNVRYGSLTVFPLFSVPPTPMRMAVVGRNDYGDYTANPRTQRVIVPGIRDTLRVQVFLAPDANNHSCFMARRNDWRAAESDRAAGQVPFRASGCFPRSDPWAPVEVLANNGQRIRVQMLRVPDLNY